MQNLLDISRARRSNKDIEQKTESFHIFTVCICIFFGEEINTQIRLKVTFTGFFLSFGIPTNRQQQTLARITTIRHQYSQYKTVLT